MSKNILIVVNASPYGSERSLSALRLAATLSQYDDCSDVNVFLISDGVGIALSGQDVGTQQTHEFLVKQIIENGGKILLCQTCIHSRGLQNANWIDGVEVGTMQDLAKWTLEADNILSF